MAAKRLLVSLDEKDFGYVEMLAKKKHTSLSKTARDLIIYGLELEEDMVFSRLAEDSLENTTEWISHEDAWK